MPHKYKPRKKQTEDNAKYSEALGNDYEKFLKKRNPEIRKRKENKEPDSTWMKIRKAIRRKLEK